MANTRPNILWYCSDQQRWDTIRALGNPHIRTDAIDALVASGVAFTHAYTQSPICTPARATFLTGRYPASHRLETAGAFGFLTFDVLQLAALLFLTGGLENPFAVLMLVPLIVFFSLQRFFVRGLMAGSVKG